MTDAPIRLTYDGGTVVVAGAPPERLLALPSVRFDPRTNCHRAEAHFYRSIVEHIRKHKIGYADDARQWQATPWTVHSDRKPFPHQAEAVETWWHARGRGVVVLPTGTGKTFVAVLAIAKSARPALLVTPTIDLLNQWYGELSEPFRVPIG